MSGPLWCKESDALLTQLWEDKLPSREIGEIMKRSKNSVVGRAHRLLLTPRPSPIAGGPSRKKKNRQPKPLTAAQRPPPTPPAPPTPEPPRQPMRVWIPVKPGPVNACQWPLGHPGTMEFRFCDQPSLPGRSYCLEHCKTAYIGFHSLSPEQPGGFYGRYRFQV
jgi:GcrA cell cycle regulator